MKKTVLGLIGLLLLVGAQSVYASTIAFDRWHYFSGVWVDGTLEEETENRDLVSLYEDDDNLGKAKSGRFTLKSEARATSDGLGYVDSLSLFYVRMMLVDGVDGDNPALFKANLRGVLRGRGDFTSSVDAFVLAYDHNIGFENILDSIRDGDDLPDSVWQGMYGTSTFAERVDVDGSYSGIVNLQNNQYAWVLAGLRTSAYADGSRAIADFYGPERSFNVSLTPLSQPGAVPEPTSLAFLGLGLLGIVRKLFRKV